MHSSQTSDFKSDRFFTNSESEVTFHLAGTWEVRAWKTKVSSEWGEGAELGCGAASLALGWTWPLEELSHGGSLPRKAENAWC